MSLKVISLGFALYHSYGFVFISLSLSLSVSSLSFSSVDFPQDSVRVTATLSESHIFSLCLFWFASAGQNLLEKQSEYGHDWLNLYHLEES